MLVNGRNSFRRTDALPVAIFLVLDLFERREFADRLIHRGVSILSGKKQREPVVAHRVKQWRDEWGTRPPTWVEIN
jgi:hypothetical protein